MQGPILKVVATTAFLAGCSQAASSVDKPDAQPASVTLPDAGPSYDPFAPMPDTSEGLTNLSSDLKAVLEGDALKDACTKYWKGATDRKSMLLCGKSMF